MAVRKESRELLSGGVGEGRAVCRGVGRRLFPTPKSGRGVLSETISLRGQALQTTADWESPEPPSEGSRGKGEAN